MSRTRHTKDQRVRQWAKRQVDHQMSDGRPSAHVAYQYTPRLDNDREAWLYRQPHFGIHIHAACVACQRSLAPITDWWRPTSAEQLRERGFQHVLLLADHLPYCESDLTRQHGMSAVLNALIRRYEDDLATVT